MTLNDIKSALNDSSYDFLRNNEHLGSSVFILALGGSFAYGMNKESSDIDLRGISFNSKNDILLGRDFEQVVDVETDTTIYSFNKMLDLLAKSNPNTIEILGCNPEHYLYLTDIGKELIANRKMFLSKICIHTFGNYAGSQLRRLENKSARFVGQAQNEEHILKSIENARYEFRGRYFPTFDGTVNLYTDKAVQEGYDSEIFMDINLSHYPLRDWTGMWNEMKSIVSSYAKIGKRNEKAISYDKLGKHMAHLIRLYMMGLDILEREEIVTYRENEHDLLMSIRNGDFLDSNSQPVSAFYDILNEYEKLFDYAKNNTSLPDKPDYNRINEFKMYVNEKIVKGDI